jgi:excisionase family DNA binding protein
MKNPPKEQESLTTAEAARVVGVSQRAILSAITDGRLAADGTPRSGYRVSREAAEAYRSRKAPTQRNQSLRQRKAVVEIEILEQRLLKEAALAEKACEAAAIQRLQREEHEGSLMKRSTHEAHRKHVGRMVDEYFRKTMGVPKQLAERLAKELEPEKCLELLAAALDRAFTDLETAFPSADDFGFEDEEGNGTDESAP